MTETTQHIAFSSAGQPCDALPRCSGVYRFFDTEGSLLYVGKSVDIHSRVAQHLNEGRKPGRHQRLMSQVARIDCQLTAGEIGALLIENAAIKSEVPLFNRRQRQLRRLWTIQLQAASDGFLKPIAIDFAPTGSREADTYGLFANKHRITTTIQNLARDHALCLRMMGLDKGKGPCFQHQLKRCDGACVGQESAESHNARLLDHLDRQRIAAWPFDGPLLLAEHTIHPVDYQPERQFHLVDQWAWHGCFDSEDDANRALTNPTAIAFDRDAYRLIYSAIYRGRVALQDALTRRPLVNPLLAERQAAS
ncbi:MAG: GIY-YIG nuclease family protein [Congregibacter sp.]|nr:GIY-YIG nuclease family protein [Congregibacter sp.]